MKKKNKKNHVRKRFSTLLLCILAIVLCAAPRGWSFFSMYCSDSDEIYYITADKVNEARAEQNLDEGGLDCLEVGAGATVNLYTDVSQYVYVYPGGILNIYSGSVGWYIAISPDEPYAVVTVYGTDFGGDGDFSTPGQVSYSGGTLTGYYPDGSFIDLLFYSNLPVYLLNAGNDLEIDIKPGGDLNSINLKSKGVVPVAVLTTDGFDASTIDPTTVTFAGAEPVRWRLCDVDDDGDVDMLYHFKTQELNLDKSSIDATLTGETNSGDVIAGTDTVRIVPTKK